MPELAGKTVVLGVSGSISAYKAADLCSRLVQEGARVLPILTSGAQRFVAAPTFWGISGQPVASDTFDEPFPGEIAHLHYVDLADLFVVAPASADLLARVAVGLCDDMLTSTLLANNGRKPVLVAPAMNTDMWQNPATQANRRALEARGFRFLEPGVGRLAEGVVGAGRLPEPPEVVEAVKQILLAPRDLDGLNVLVTAGPTREPVDPVRFLSNRSSGKMGYALAGAAVARGARVILVTGPVALAPPPGLAAVVRVETAAEMEDAVLSRAPSMDVVVQAAAVADFRPAAPAARKLKKSDGVASLPLRPTHDFSVTLGERKRAGQVLVGFAAETEDLEANARAKLTAKNLDLIIANDVTRPGAGFEVDTNVVTLIDASGQSTPLPQMSKRAVSDALWDAVARITSPPGPIP